jgi:NTP pyrophosphatase (non-canonical NTP hydrolase)
MTADPLRPFPTQAQALAWVRARWPERTAPIWRAAKLCEESGEVMGAVIKMGEGRKSLEDLRLESAQVVICAMALAESAGFDLWAAVADEWARLGGGS